MLIAGLSVLAAAGAAWADDDALGNNGNFPLNVKGGSVEQTGRTDDDGLANTGGFPLNTGGGARGTEERTDDDGLGHTGGFPLNTGGGARGTEERTDGDGLGHTGGFPLNTGGGAATTEGSTGNFDYQDSAADDSEQVAAADKPCNVQMGGIWAGMAAATRAMAPCK